MTALNDFCYHLNDANAIRTKQAKDMFEWMSEKIFKWIK